MPVRDAADPFVTVGGRIQKAVGKFILVLSFFAFEFALVRIWIFSLAACTWDYCAWQ
ncbi:hypothetical protein BDW02DRAFT_570798 [Decorospora gaudefroyi]|uniref:Uncharacterized protein n=1 Tax=Decorospora gaudefroyi TaxID=184978 RepID=A0A6A5KCL1_9PLEO|nr:hypothetical protein BDW02DRAFT_570798 [Decorospora gaudefroyi]